VADHASKTLEDFALKGNHLAKMTGISLATHAIPDAFLLMHSGVGCKYKTAAQIGNHDWGSHPNMREAWTQVGENELVTGHAKRIGPFARAWYERRRPELMIVVSAYFIELTGEGFDDAVQAAEKTVPCDMTLISTAAPNDGFFEGYAAVTTAVLERMDFETPPTEPRGASIVGWFFHRYEPDQKGDVKQLEGLLKAAGLTMGPVLLSGTGYRDLLKAPASKYALLLPYAKPKERKIRKLLKKRDIVPLDLPIGVAGTARFVRELVAQTGGDARRAEAWLEGQTAAVRGQLDKLRDHFRHVEVAVFAETPLAAGLVSLLDEMGIRVPLVGLRDQNRCLGGRTAFLQTLERNGVPDLDRIEVLEAPSLRLVRERCRERMAQGRLRGIVGSSHELDLFVQDRRGAFGAHTFLIETGFPSDEVHAALALPTLGFAGAVAWAQRMLDALRAPRQGGGAGTRV
jgi:nitrogenase molybdenum-iron protein alpha/beta subunit